MNKIILRVISLLVLSGWVDSASLNSQCGYTPKYPSPAPDEYSWTASLQYGKRPSFGFCGGSVISSRYVLTVASCVTGENIDGIGGLTGVRLGDFSRSPICDYGAPNCEHYQQFSISELIVHANYNRRSFKNDIALLRLNQSIIFTDKLRPICLPVDSAELFEGTTLTVSGWGKTVEIPQSVAKRTKNVQLWNREMCDELDKDQSIICAGNADGKTPCDGDGGSPLMRETQTGQMVLEGMLSHGPPLCFSKFSPSGYTRVSSFLSWIASNIHEN